jgi:cellobiose phosphorylase
MRTDDVSQLLVSNFAGIRFDGSNATIIGHKPGEFIADRNNIPRVWMDHGAWPLFTTKMYLDWTGDLDFLLITQPYFRDHLTHRSQKIDLAWTAEQGTCLRTIDDEPYQGSIFEHLLIQNLIPFFNVGSHNCILLEGADWNDALDMASKNGESVAFTSFYAGNLLILADLATQLSRRGIQEISIANELEILLKSGSDHPDYDDPEAKRELLANYLDSCAEHVSGQQVLIDALELAANLQNKAEWMISHLRKKEWIDNGDHGWFNGYYDDLGRRVEGIFDGTVQITLTGQVFPLMFGIATDKQAREIAASVHCYLYDPDLNGVRLNTEFTTHNDALGRMFGFAYGHKENGAMFSHMAVMYAYALFERGLSSQARKLLDDLYQHCQNFQISRMYPGLPEYLDPSGRGLYPYLTGSASWYMLTIITKVFGLRGFEGDLIIQPDFDIAWFDDQGSAAVHFPFAGRILRIEFHQDPNQESELLIPDRVERGGQLLPSTPIEGGVLIKRNEILSLPGDGTHQLDVFLVSDPNRVKTEPNG